MGFKEKQIMNKQDISFLEHLVAEQSLGFSNRVPKAIRELESLGFAIIREAIDFEGRTFTVTPTLEGEDYMEELWNLEKNK